MLRIDVLLRRIYKSTVKSSQQRVLQLCKLSLDKFNQRIVYHEQPIVLTPIQFRLLWRLAESQNKILSKAYLYQTVLDKSFSRYDYTLDMHISSVRKKLAEAGMPIKHLVTVHGKGYCFS